jgi:hypothetical protein
VVTDDMSLVAPPSPLYIELSYHRLGDLIGIELAVTRELHNPDGDKLDNGHGFGARQPQAGADLLKSPVHRVDLVRVKRGVLALTVGFVQCESSQCGAPLGARGSTGA